MPEQWWGKWLAENGYVVLTSWSFIRHYREDSDYRTGINERVYARFGHWLPMAKMVHDARREAEYLRSLKQVDARRLGFIGFSLSAKAAVYIAAFAPEFKATVALDPHIAVNGGTNWYAPWYLDWLRPFPDIPTRERTVLSLLNPDPQRPGFEHDHHELMALAAPRAFLLIGGSQSEDAGGDSDDLQSWGYFNRAREVYQLLGIPDRIAFVSTSDGHHANGPNIDPAWRAILRTLAEAVRREIAGNRGREGTSAPAARAAGATRPPAENPGRSERSRRATGCARTRPRYPRTPPGRSARAYAGCARRRGRRAAPSSPPSPVRRFRLSLPAGSRGRAASTML